VKKIFLLLLLLLNISCAGTKFYLFGVDTDVIKDATRGEILEAAAGAVVSMGTHVAGHYLLAEIFDVEIHQDGRREVVDSYESDSDVRWFARGGFLLQSIVSTSLTSLETTRHSYFTKGYVLTTAISIWSYPLRYGSDGDYGCLDDHGGNWELEYGIYSAVALHNMLRVPWKKDSQ